MGLPLIAAAAGTQLLGSVLSAKEQEKARKAEIERQQKIARRNAIERAIGLNFGPAKREKIITPNLTGPAILQGIGQLGLTMGSSGFGSNVGKPGGLSAPLRVPEIPIG